MAVEERDETRNEHPETGHAAESNDCLSFGCDGVTKAQQHPTNACRYGREELKSMYVAEMAFE